MDSSKLSDSQLYALVMNKELPSELAEEVNSEFKRRDLDVETIDRLDLEWKAKEQRSTEPLPLKTKLMVIAMPLFDLVISMPFLVLVIAYIANREMGKGNMVRWNQYWRYVVIGHVVWFFILVLIVRMVN